MHAPMPDGHDIGARPRRNPVTLGDIIAAIYTCLGIEANLKLME